MGLQHLAPGSVGRRPQYLQQRQYPQQRQLSRQYATAAAQLAAEDGEEEEVAVGSILEFERGREYHIGRAIKPLAGAQGWQVEAARCAGCVSRPAALLQVPQPVFAALCIFTLLLTRSAFLLSNQHLPCFPSTCSGTLYSVKHADIKFVLPGGPARSSADLAAVAAQAGAEAAQPDLLQLAWELASGEGEPLEPASHSKRPAGESPSDLHLTVCWRLACSTWVAAHPSLAARAACHAAQVWIKPPYSLCPRWRISCSTAPGPPAAPPRCACCATTASISSRQVLRALKLGHVRLLQHCPAC